MSVATATAAIWIAVGLVWGVEGLRARQAGPPVAVRPAVGHYVLLAGTWILFTRNLGYRPLTWRVLPDVPVWAWTGLVLTFVGAAFAIWARLGLGQQWSSRVRIADDHQLIRGGPYAYVRHPIYSGLLLALVGTALGIGETRAVIGLALAFIGWLWKSRAEEQLLLARFGDDYVRYRHEVKAMIPYVL